MNKEEKEFQRILAKYYDQNRKLTKKEKEFMMDHFEGMIWKARDAVDSLRHELIRLRGILEK